MSDKRDNVLRVHGTSPLGTSLFVGLRTLDVFLQYGFLAKGLADPLLNRLTNSPGLVNSAPIVALGLPLQSLIVLGMAAGTAIKQNYTILALSNEVMPPTSAIAIAIFNSIFNSANSIFSLTAAATYLIPSFLTSTDNKTGLSPLFIVGSLSYVVGISIEAISEIQRTSFKKDARNAGKPYTGGLFSLARHINYGGYTIMRSSYALATGGWIWGASVFYFFFSDFVGRGVPVLDEYCSKRYGASWADFKQKVPYKLLPGIY